MNGFENFSQFIHAWIKGDYPQQTERRNEQIEKLLERL